MKKTKGWDGWGDTKRFLVEDLGVYGTLLLLDFGHDFLINVVYNLGLWKNPYPNPHPFDFGFIQWITLIFCVVQILRKLDQLKYHW